MECRPDTTDKMTAEAILIYDEYKAKELQKHYKDGDVFIDIGSHIGSWALLMASLNYSFKVLAYEALPENYEVIQKNIMLNDQYNLEAFNYALSDSSEGKQKIYFTNSDTPFNKHHRFIGSSMGAGANFIEVDKISLSDILAKVDHVKVLKTDCEGGECLAFPTLSNEELNKIEFIVGEFHGLGMDYDKFWGIFAPHFTDESDTPREKYLRDFTFKNKRLS